jgi:hypothetical protein
MEISRCLIGGVRACESEGYNGRSKEETLAFKAPSEFASVFHDTDGPAVSRPRPSSTSVCLVPRALVHFPHARIHPHPSHAALGNAHGDPPAIPITANGSAAMEMAN